MTGSCLCGSIEFEAQEIPGLVFNCHCSRCRKSHGATFATQAFAVRSSLRFIRGHENLKEFADGGGIRTFCGICGSRLLNYARDGGNYLSIAIACLEGYEGQPVAHAFVSSKAAWYEPDSAIPGFEGLPPSALTGAR